MRPTPIDVPPTPPPGDDGIDVGFTPPPTDLADLGVTLPRGNRDAEIDALQDRISTLEALVALFARLIGEEAS